MQVMLKNIRIAFPALGAPQSFGEGDPAYGGKLIVDPKGEHVKQIKDAILEAAKDKWKDEAQDVIDALTDDRKICFVEAEYRNKKTRQPYAGFEGKFYLSARNASTQPTVVDRLGNEVTSKAEIERLIYSGCYVRASVDIWPQDNKWGQRINCTLRGVMFANDGENFGGGSTASASEFADFAVDAEDLL
jgi:hypothetical protein